MAVKPTKKSSASTEIVLGQAAQQITKAVSELNAATTSVNELNLLKQQEEAIKIQIQDREAKLQAIGSKYEPKINEIDSKLQANASAKDAIISSIEQVKKGIINNLK